jgi:hypothetical protein
MLIQFLFHKLGAFTGILHLFYFTSSFLASGNKIILPMMISSRINKWSFLDRRFSFFYFFGSAIQILYRTAPQNLLKN